MFKRDNILEVCEENTIIFIVNSYFDADEEFSLIILKVRETEAKTAHIVLTFCSLKKFWTIIYEILLGTSLLFFGRTIIQRLLFLNTVRKGV